MRLRHALLILLATILVQPAIAQAQDGEPWQEVFGGIPILEGGRVMPMDTYARRLAVELTGRTKWSEGEGREDVAGRAPIELLADLMARPAEMMDRKIIAVDHQPLKAEIGLHPDRRFFSPREIMRSAPLHEIVEGLRLRREANSSAKATTLERHAGKAQSAAMRVGMFARDMIHFPIVPQKDSPEFLAIDAAHGPPGTERIRAAFGEFLTAYREGRDPAQAAATLQAEIDAYAPLPAEAARAIELEHFYNSHKPWRMAVIATIVALLLFLARWLLRAKLFTYLAAVAIVWAIAEQVLGLTLRIIILDRPPVSNTYEAVLWMGMVALAFGLVGQAINRRGWYLVGGLAASLIALIFAQLVPLTDQTNSIPAVLRSNYWLIVHVMTIVASYGAFLLAAVLGHAFLIRDVILRRKPDPKARLIVQSYRLMQVGLVLLTAGTILGGVWAAESWGRFWGWDPKETWALISIVVYFAMLHARFSGWIRDFGLAVASIVGFLSIVWCFYGVNYVMATGLHSYGFGSGGEKWVLLWGLLEMAFIVACFIRFRARGPRAVAPDAAEETTSPAAATPSTA